MDIDPFEYRDSYEEEDSFTIDDFRKKWENRIQDNAEISTDDAETSGHEEFTDDSDVDTRSEGSCSHCLSDARVGVDNDVVMNKSLDKAVPNEDEDVFLPAVPRSQLQV